MAKSNDRADVKNQTSKRHRPDIENQIAQKGKKIENLMKELNVLVEELRNLPK